MGEPEQLAEGMRRLATYAEAAGRNAGDIGITYRTHHYELKDDGSGTPSGSRELFTGTGDQIASDIRRYEDMGVNYLVVDFARVSSSLDEMLGHMEDTANRVWPRV